MRIAKIFLFILIIFIVFNCSSVYADEWPIEKYNNSDYLYKTSNMEETDGKMIKGTFTSEFVDEDGEYGDKGYVGNYGTSVAKQIISYTYTLPSDYDELRNFNDSTKFEVNLPDSDMIDISKASNEFSVSASFSNYKNEEELEKTIELILSYEFDNCTRTETSISGKRAIKFTAVPLREPRPDVFGYLQYEENIVYLVVMDEFQVNGASLLLYIHIKGSGSTVISPYGREAEANDALWDYYDWHKETHAELVRELVNGDLTYELESFVDNNDTSETGITGKTKNKDSDKKDGTNTGLIIGGSIGAAIIGGGAIIRLKNKKLKNLNTGLSDYGKKVQKEYKESIAKEKHKVKIDKMKYDHGLDKDATEKDLKKHLIGERVKNQVDHQKHLAREGNLASAQNAAESVESAADYTIAVGEAVVPGGKVVSATYKGLKNVATTTADKGLESGLTEGVLRGVTDAATTMMDGGIKKAATALAGETVANVTGAAVRGEDLAKATKEGVARGTVNASTGVISDTMGDVGGKAGSAIGNVGSMAYSKNISEPKIKENIDKDKKK